MVGAIPDSYINGRYSRGYLIRVSAVYWLYYYPTARPIEYTRKYIRGGTTCRKYSSDSTPSHDVYTSIFSENFAPYFMGNEN